MACLVKGTVTKMSIQFYNPMSELDRFVSTKESGEKKFQGYYGPPSVCMIILYFNPIYY